MYCFVLATSIAAAGISITPVPAPRQNVHIEVADMTYSNLITRCRSLRLVVVMAMSTTAMIAWCEEPKPSSKSATIEGLRDFTGIVGGWRGVGQVKRGSPQGAWQEQAELVWELKPQSIGIRWNFEAGKEWKSALLSYDDSTKLFTLLATLPDESLRKYQGKLEDKRLVLEGLDDKKDVHRMTLTILNENRMLVLLERRPEQQSFFTRVGEVAYQRQGTKIAAVGGAGPACIVTGGTGTIAVMHKGKTYYVCCTGCRDAFNDDPEGTLAAYEKKKANPEK